MDDLCVALSANQAELSDIIDSLYPFEQAEEAIEYIWQGNKLRRLFSNYSWICEMHCIGDSPREDSRSNYGREFCVCINFQFVYLYQFVYSLRHLLFKAFKYFGLYLIINSLIRFCLPDLVLQTPHPP